MAQPTLGTPASVTYDDQTSPEDPVTSLTGFNCSGANGLIVHVCQWGAIGLTVPDGVTYNGVALTMVKSQSYGAGLYNQTSQWFLLSPDSGAHDIVVNLADGEASIGVIIAVPISGLDTGDPYNAGVGSDNGVVAVSGADSITVTDTNGATGCLEVDTVSGVVSSGTPAVLTVGAGQTQDAQTATSAAGVSITGATSHQDGAASVVMSWTPDVPTFYSMVSVSYNGAAAAGGTSFRSWGGGSRPRTLTKQTIVTF
jgi:hypothetical protein